MCNCFFRTLRQLKFYPKKVPWHSKFAYNLNKLTARQIERGRKLPLTKKRSWMKKKFVRIQHISAILYFWIGEKIIQYSLENNPTNSYYFKIRKETVKVNNFLIIWKLNNAHYCGHFSKLWIVHMCVCLHLRISLYQFR